MLTALTLLTRALRRGNIIPQTCEACDSVPVVPYHDDVTQPLEVRWFCRSHRADHRQQRNSLAVVQGYLKTVELYPDPAERMGIILPTLTAVEQEKIRNRASFVSGRRIDSTSPLYQQQLLRSFQNWETTQIALETSSKPLHIGGPPARPQILQPFHLSEEEINARVDAAFATSDFLTEKVSVEINRYTSGKFKKRTVEPEPFT